MYLFFAIIWQWKKLATIRNFVHLLWSENLPRANYYPFWNFICLKWWRC